MLSVAGMRLKLTLAERKKTSTGRSRSPVQKKQSAKQEQSSQDHEDDVAADLTAIPKTTIAGDHDSAAFEEAIRKSVAATSKGDPEEDKLIEMAIRASIEELQRASAEGQQDKLTTEAG